MSSSKDSFLVRIATHVSYAVFLLVGGGVGFGLGYEMASKRAHEDARAAAGAREKLDAEVRKRLADQVFTFATNELVSLSSSESSLKVLKIEEPLTLDVT